MLNDKSNRNNCYTNSKFHYNYIIGAREYIYIYIYINVLLTTPNQWLFMHIGIIHICFFFNSSLVCTMDFFVYNNNYSYILIIIILFHALNLLR